MYRGTSYASAFEVVQSQAFDVLRIRQLQELTGQGRQGVFLTTQEATGQFYADIAGMHGRGLGPAVVQMEVLTSELEAFLQKHQIPFETPVDRLPWQTETLIPFEAASEFESFCRFFHH